MDLAFRNDGVTMIRSLQPIITMRLALIALVLAVLLAVLSWNHLLPGGWFLRDLIEAPEIRERRLYKEHRQQRLALFREDRELLRPTTLFFGSSTIERFPLQHCFPGLRALNRGIGDEPIQDMMNRLEESLPALGRAQVKAGVVYLGAVDFRKGRVDQRQLLRHIEAFTQKLQTLVPKIELLLLGLLPGDDDDPRYSGQELADLNRTLGSWAQDKGHAFFDLNRSPFRNDAGRLEASLAADRFHLNRAGYEKLAELLLAGSFATHLKHQ